MPVIAVSSDSFEQGEAVAREVAQRLGYQFLGRELVAEVAKDKGLAEEEIFRALEEATRFLGMRARRRRELLTHLKAACLERLKEDNIVCHGLGAHLYVIGVSHAMRVRVLEKPEKTDGKTGPRAGHRGREGAQALGTDDPGSAPLVPGGLWGG